MCTLHVTKSIAGGKSPLLQPSMAVPVRGRHSRSYLSICHIRPCHPHHLHILPHYIHISPPRSPSLSPTRQFNPQHFFPHEHHIPLLHMPKPSQPLLPLTLSLNCPTVMSPLHANFLSRPSWLLLTKIAAPFCHLSVVHTT